MPERTYGVHLGSETSDLISGFVVEEGFLTVYETKKEGRSHSEVSRKIREFISQNPFLEVTDFESGCQKLVQEHELSSLVAVFLSNDQVWTYSEEGIVLLLRKQELYQTSQEKKALQGEYLENDLFFLTTHSLKSQINSYLSDLSPAIMSPKEIIEMLQEKIPKEQVGAILVVKTAKVQPLSFDTPIDAPTPPPPPAALFPDRKANPLPGKVSNLFQNRYLKLGILLVVLVLILLKSFFFIRDTLEKRREQKLTETVAELTQKYSKLEQEFPQNPTQTTQKINELRTKVEELKADNPKNLELINPLSEKLKKSTATFGNPKVKSAKLFYDPALIDKKARITYLDITENYLAIVDAENKRGYLIDISSKDHSDFSLSKLKRPSLATEYDGELFVYSTNEGIFESEDGALKKVLNYEKSWGVIVDFKVFNGNLYLLSSTRDEIFKFTPIEGGYGSKSSYFQSGQSLDLENAQSLAIDFSVYILGDSLYKYTAGARDGFNLSNQLDFSQMIKVFKTPENDYLYLLDSTNSRVVVLNENGRVIQSLFSPKLENSSSFGVFRDEKVIFVHQNKLYELDNL